MSERLQMEGKLAELKRARSELIIQGNAHARAIKEALALVAVSSIKETDADSVLVHAKGLKAIRDEYLRIEGDIEALEKELGRR